MKICTFHGYHNSKHFSNLQVSGIPHYSTNSNGRRSAGGRRQRLVGRHLADLLLLVPQAEVVAVLQLLLPLQDTRVTLKFA